MRSPRTSFRTPSSRTAAAFRAKAIVGCLLLLATTSTAMAGDRLSSEQLIDAMIEAHGGMERWAAAPTVRFEDEFVQAGAEAGAVSRVTVEQGARRAYIDFPGTEMRMSWDGEKAWSENWQSPFPPRFLALLNYHFLNLPWLAKDPGVHLSEPGKAKLWDDPTEYHTVKLTYGEGVGDTPDDYYVLYIDPKTHRLHACEYIVTYGAILPEGVEASPPNVLIFDEHTEVNGLVVPTQFTIVTKQDRAPYFVCKIDNWSFTDAFDADRMSMPTGAQVDTTAD